MTGPDHRHAQQRRHRDEPGEQAGSIHPEPADARVPGDEGHRGGQRQPAQGGRLGASRHCQCRAALEHGGADRQHAAGGPAGVGRERGRAEPRQQRHRQKRERRLAEQRSGGQGEPGAAGAPPALGQRGAGHHHGGGGEHSKSRRLPGQQRPGDPQQHRRATDHQPHHGGVGAPDRTDHAEVERNQPAGGERQHQPDLARDQARQAPAGGTLGRQKDGGAGGVPDRLATHDRVMDQQFDGNPMDHFPIEGPRARQPEPRRRPRPRQRGPRARRRAGAAAAARAWGWGAAALPAGAGAARGDPARTPEAGHAASLLQSPGHRPRHLPWSGGRGLRPARRRGLPGGPAGLRHPGRRAGRPSGAPGRRWRAGRRPDPRGPGGRRAGGERASPRDPGRRRAGREGPGRRGTGRWWAGPARGAPDRLAPHRLPSRGGRSGQLPQERLGGGAAQGHVAGAGACPGVPRPAGRPGAARRPGRLPRAGSRRRHRTGRGPGRVRLRAGPDAAREDAAVALRAVGRARGPGQSGPARPAGPHRARPGPDRRRRRGPARRPAPRQSCWTGRPATMA